MGSGTNATPFWLVLSVITQNKLWQHVLTMANVPNTMSLVTNLGIMMSLSPRTIGKHLKLTLWLMARYTSFMLPIEITESSQSFILSRC